MIGRQKVSRNGKHARIRSDLEVKQCPVISAALLAQQRRP